MRHDPTLEQIAELMDEMDAYQGRTVVIKIGGNSIAEDEHFLAKIAKQIRFLHINGIKIVLVHGGGPQIDQALRDKKIKTDKGADGRRITSPKAMAVVHRTMNKMNLKVVKALTNEGCDKNAILCAAKHPRILLQAEPLGPGHDGMPNRSGRPIAVFGKDIAKALAHGKIAVLHSVGIGTDGKTSYNINGDDYAMAVAIDLAVKRLILVTNVAGVLDKNHQRIPAIDQNMADELTRTGVITGGMVPKVESALWVVKQGVGGVAIIDGFAPWAILAEMLTHEGFGTLFQAQVG
jgi:acetylglutamate kinase